VSYTLSQLQCQGKDLDLRLKNFGAIENDPTLSEAQKQHAYEVLEADHKSWKANMEQYEARNGNIPMSNAIDTGSQPARATKALSNIRVNGKSIYTTGGMLQPLTFDEHAIEVLSKAFEAKTPVSTLVSTKGFNTVESGFTTTTPSLLPAQLAPGVVDRVHPPRVLDHIPCIPCTTLNHEFIKDTTTVDGVTGTTAEGATAPDVTLSFEALIVSMVAIKATFGVSVESVADYSTLLGYTQGEVMRQITDSENSQILTATGTTGNMNGLINQAGNTIAVPTTLATGVTPMDYILQGINTVAAVPNVLGTVDQIWMHPDAWYSMVGLKDGLNRYLITPDPTRDAPKELFGIPVYVTTALVDSSGNPLGTAVLLDSTKFGYGIIRSGVEMWQGYNDLDFSQFIQRYALMWRGQLAVVRAGAICTVSGLATSPFTPPVAS
jgi:HK97 family phage major capsid protein